ncbi:MAG TPA: hypothetical protein DIW47_13395 [Bacteroidetes bacterium]|nr:hypothetical protein [Bacteroidota bacterium]
MMKRALFVVILILAYTGIQAQGQLTPKWKQGDSLRYFLSESELIDNERISLKTYELELRIRETSEKRSILDGYLYLSAEKEQGEHWTIFYKLLRKVPFTFYFEPGRQKTFSQAIQVETTKKALDGILLELLGTYGVEPLAYGEISTWLGKNSETGVPDILLGYFIPMDKVFDKYGVDISPSAQFAIADEVECADSLLHVMWNLSLATYPAHDTLMQEISMGLDSATKLETYTALNRCGKLKGLETEVHLSSYSSVTRERWAALLKEEKIVHYAYDEEIRIGMNEIQNWQRVQKRIICLW